MCVCVHAQVKKIHICMCAQTCVLWGKTVMYTSNTVFQLTQVKDGWKVVVDVNVVMVLAVV